MYKLKKGYEGYLTTKGYIGLISEAPQEILEAQYHSGNPNVEYFEEVKEIEDEKPKKRKRKAKPQDKAIDSKEGEELPKLED